MNRILDQFSRSTPTFRPRTEQEFFALQLARRLGDVTSIPHYVRLVDRHPRETILKAYRRVMQSHPAASKVQRLFHFELEKFSRREAR